MKPEVQWHKIVALLMHEFEITEFTVTSGMISGYKEAFNPTPDIVCEEREGEFRIRIVPKTETRRLVQ